MAITARETHVKTGYKLTEVGVIPEEWEVKTLGEITAFSQYGISSSSGTFCSAPMLKMNNLQDGGINLAGLSYIKLSKAEMDSLMLMKGDLLINRTNSADLVGKTAIYDLDGEYVFASYLVRFRLNPPISPVFINYFLNSKPGQTKLKLLATKGVSQANINPSTLKRLFLIPIPPSNEQTAIAAALSDVDALLTSLDKLIAKKRSLKQATMQQLLTGERRLPGFSGEGSAKLGDFFDLNPGRGYIDNTDVVTFLGMEDVSENGMVLKQTILLFSSIKKGFTFFERNDVLVAKITPCFENGKGACLDTLETKIGFGSTEFHVLRAKNNSIPRYIFYQTQMIEFRRTLEAEMIGTAGQKRVPAQAIVDYALPVFHSKEEQQAIAAVLSDMDAEIVALEQKREKTRALKQGMMQELLTGRIRLQ